MALQSESLLLGFTPFFRKEVQEWAQQKQVAIAVVLLIPFTLTIIMVLLTKWLEASGGAAASVTSSDLTLNATYWAYAPFWIGVITVLFSNGLISNEQVAGTLSWNLTKPLSRLSFLLGKGLVCALAIWLTAIVAANFISLVISAIGIGGKSVSIPLTILGNLSSFLPIAFWVLLCLFAGMFLKDQAVIFAFVLGLSILGVGLANHQFLSGLVGIQLHPSQQAWIDAVATYYPTNVAHGICSSDGTIHFLRFLVYLIYMAVMSLSTYRMFDQKDFS